MGATASSAHRDSRCEEDAAAEQRTAAARDAADDTLLQRNGQVSRLNPNTKNPADEVNGHFEERVLADVCSGFVTIKEDGTETIEDLQDVVSLQPNTKNNGRDVINEDGVTVKDETLEIEEVNSINEVGFKKVFRFVGFKFTLKKDTCEKAEGEGPQENEQEEKVTGTSEDSKENDAKEKNTVAANINTPDELLKNEETGQPEAPEDSHKTENETQLDQDTGMVEQNMEVTPDKEEVNMIETSPESEEPMSPIKQFFTQGIFASLRKKKKEDEIQKETKEEELIITDQIEDAEMSERDEKVDTKCMCLDIPYIMHEEDKGKLLPEEELQHSIEKEMVQASPLKRLFRKFSSRRQRESKAAESVIEDGDKVTEQPESSLELTKIEKEDEPVVGELKPSVEEQLADVSPQESKKKSDSIVSWEALICGSSAKKRARKTTEGETADNEKTNESPLGSSIEADYDNLTSSNEQDGDGESESTWQVFKKMVTPKRKVRTGESSSSEHIPSDSEMNKDDSLSMKKLIVGRKKRKCNGRQEQTSSDETGKDAETGDEDDETPAIIPLSEYEIIDPESVKKVNEEQVEITIEHEMPEGNSEGLEQDTTSESEPKLEDKVSNNAAPLIIRVLSEDFEEVTDFISKYQQLSDIPEEGIIEESIETPISSSEWTTQDDTLAEDIVDLTADAVTAPEPASEQLIGDNSTEMVSALSQLTESPTTSGHISPMSAEYGVQMSNMIFQEAVESICMTPSVQLVTTKDESQESLAVSFSPYIIQTTTPEETKVLVAHMKTEATAICTGLISQEMEPVEELLSAPLVQEIPEVSDAVLTEIVCDNHKDAPEVAGLGTDEVYKAEVWQVKTEFQDVIIANEEEAATETKVYVEQVIQQLGEPLIEVATESHVVDMLDKVECLTKPETGFQLGSVEMQDEAMLDQVIPENTQVHQLEGPLHSVLEEQPVHYTEVTAEVEKDIAGLEDNVHIDKVELIHVDEIQVVIKDAILNTAETEVDSVVEVVSAGDSKVTVEDIGEKNEETGEETKTNVQQEIRDIPEEQSLDVALEVDQNIKNKQISETAAESLSREEFEEKQLDIGSTVTSLLEKVKTAIEDKVTAELGICPKEMDTDLDNIKVEESASEEMDSVCTTEKPAVKDMQLLTKTKSGESENQELCEITEQDVVTNNVDTITVTDVSEISNDVLEHKEITTDPRDCSKVILADLESVMPQNEAKELETDEWSQDIEHSLKTSKNEQMVGIIENTTKQSGKEEPEVLALTISELPNTTEEEDASAMTEISAEAIGGEQNDQVSVETAKEIKETDIPEIKDKVSDVTKLEPESPQPTEIKVIVTAVSESVKMAQSDDAKQMENGMIEQKDETTEKTRLKCESPEQFLDKPLAMELQVENTEMKDEISSVKYLKEEASAVTTLEVAPIVQLPPQAFEMKAETVTILEVTVPEVQIQEANELRAETLEPNLETPVVAEVKVEPAVVTELGVDTPVVTAVVTEFEVETPVLTSMAETIDTHDSAETSLNQNTDINTSKLTTIVKNQGVDELIVTSVIPATLNQDMPDVILDSKSVIVALIGDTSVETLLVEEPPVDPVVLPVEEMQNVIPMVETPAVGSVTVTETTPTAESTETGTTIPETPVDDPVLPPLVVSVTSVKPTEALTPVSVTSVKPTEALTPVLEMPDVTPVLETPTVDSAVEAPTVTSLVLVTGAEPPVVVTPAETQVAKTTVVSPVVETPVISITSVVTAMAQALLVTPVDEASALVSETATEAVDPVEETLFESPEVETLGVMSTTHATPVLDSMTPSPVGAETPIVSPEVELCTVNSIQIAVTDDLIQTPTLVSVVVKEAAQPVMPSVIAVVEISSVETPLNPYAMTYTPLMIAEVTTVSEETVTSPVQTLVVDDLMATSTGIPAPEALQVTPEIETPTVAPEIVTSAIASKVVILDVMPGVTETTLQMVENKTKLESTVEAEDDVKPTAITEKDVKTIQCISTEENSKGSLQQESVITSTESQSEVEDDVWEDAVDNIDDGASQMMETSVSPQDNAVKHGSDAAV